MESISGPDGLLRWSVTHRCFPISWMGRFPTINSSIILIIPVLLTKTWLLRLLQDKFLSHFARGIQIVVTHVCRSISRLVSLFIYPPWRFHRLPQLRLYFGKFDFSNSSILFEQVKNEAREESEDVFRFEEDYWSKHGRNFPFDRSVRLDARARAVSTGPPA